MMMIPAAISMYLLIPLKIRTLEKTMLTTIKTAVNPKIKNRVWRITRPRISPSGRRVFKDSGIPWPAPSGASPEAPIKKRYEGIRGNTQGEKKESSPAAKDRTADTSPAIFLIIYCGVDK
jgi:hypothetical protein